MRLPILILSSLLCMGAVREASSPSLETPCLAPNEFAQHLRDYVLEVINSTDSSRIELRAALDLPPTPPAQVLFESDSALCTTAAHSHAIAAGTDTLAPRPVYLLRVGSTRFVVFNGHRIGEFTTSYVFDASFQLLEAF